MISGQLYQSWMGSNRLGAKVHHITSIHSIIHLSNCACSSREWSNKQTNRTRQQLYANKFKIIISLLFQRQIDARAREANTTVEQASRDLLAEKQPSLTFATPEQIGQVAVFLSRYTNKRNVKCHTPALFITTTHYHTNTTYYYNISHTYTHFIDHFSHSWYQQPFFSSVRVLHRSQESMCLSMVLGHHSENNNNYNIKSEIKKQRTAETMIFESTDCWNKSKCFTLVKQRTNKHLCINDNQSNVSYVYDDDDDGGHSFYAHCHLPVKSWKGEGKGEPSCGCCGWNGLPCTGVCGPTSMKPGNIEEWLWFTEPGGTRENKGNTSFCQTYDAAWMQRRQHLLIWFQSLKVFILFILNTICFIIQGSKHSAQWCDGVYLHLVVCRGDTPSARWASQQLFKCILLSQPEHMRFTIAYSNLCT